MTLVRTFFGLLLFLAPVMPGFFQLSLAERCEEHQEVASSGTTATAPAHLRVGERPKPRRPRHRLAGCFRRAVIGHAGLLLNSPPPRPRRALRRVFCGGDDSDPDPSPKSA